jgi:uncharacterized protein YndB with AHSA1/START domain
MTVTNVDKDLDQCRLIVTAEFDVTAERAWQLWADPRQLERWWGPPFYPATFEKFDFVPGGGITYFMTSPEGEKFPGWWTVAEIDAPRTLVFTDGFSDAAGEPVATMPVTTTVVEISDRDGGVVMTITSKYESLAEMEKMLEMGMEQGLVLALGQIEDILDAT